MIGRIAKEILGRLLHGRPVRTIVRTVLITLALVAIAGAVLYLVAQAQRAPIVDARGERKVGIIVSQLLRAPDALVVGSKVGEVRVLDPASGEPRYSATLPQAELHGLAVYGGWLFAAQNEEVVRLDGRLAVQRERAVGAFGVRAIAGGPFGLFAIARTTGDLLCLNWRSLTLRSRIDSTALGGEPVALAVTRFAVWVLVGEPAALLRLSRSSVDGSLVVDKRVDVPDGAHAIAVGAGHVAVLSPKRLTAMLVDVVDVRRTRTFRVERGARDLAIGNGSLWVLSNRDSVSQRRLSDGRRLGEPISVGADPLQVAVSLQAAWTGSTGSSVLTRLDLRRLPALRNPPAAPVILGFDRSLVLGMSVLSLLGALALGLLYHWVNPYRTLPRYQAGAALRLLALNPDEAGWLLAGRKVKRVNGARAGGVHVPFIEVELSGGDNDEMEAETVEELLHRQLIHGVERRIFARDLGWTLPDARWWLPGHSRRQRLPPLRARHRELEGHDVLIDGHTWTVVSGISGSLKLVTTRLRDPHRPDGPDFKVPPGGEIVVDVEPHHLHPRGHQRLKPGQQLKFDMIVSPVPAETPGGGLQCELVMAYSPVLHAQTLSGKRR